MQRKWGESDKRVLAALEKLQRTGKPFSQKTVLAEAQTTATILYRRPELRARVNAAVKASGYARKGERTATNGEKLVAILEQTPGLNHERIAVRLGIAPYEECGRRSKVVQRLLHTLLSKELIWRERPWFSKQERDWKYYAAGYEKEAVLFQPIRPAQLKVWIEPSLAGRRS
jgi:hypothetical protein